MFIRIVHQVGRPMWKAYSLLKHNDNWRSATDEELQELLSAALKEHAKRQTRVETKQVMATPAKPTITSRALRIARLPRFF